MRSTIMLFRVILNVVMLCATTLCLKAESVFDLKGKSIILTPIRSSVGSVYDKQSLKKLLFKESYLYQIDITGKRVDVLDVVRVNEGKKKGDAIVIKMQHEQDTVALYCPLKFDPKADALYREYYMKTRSETGFSSVYYNVSIENINVNYYDADKIDMILNRAQNRAVYALSNTYNVIERNYQYGLSAFRDDRHSYLSAEEEYTFVDFVFEEKSKYPQIMLCAKFLDKKGEIYTTPIKSSSHNIQYKKSHFSPGNIHTYNVDLLTLDNFEDNIILKERMVEECNRQVDTALLSKIVETYVGQELYLTSYNYRFHDSIEYIHSSDYTEYGDIPRRTKYHNALSVELFRVSPKSDKLQHFLVLEGEGYHNSRFKYALPIVSGIDKLLLLAKDQREVERKNSIAKQQREQERLALIEKENREYRTKLVKKYGQHNADLILKEQVKLGFTKEMCVEAWGKPYDINRTITNYGTIEQWVYGIGTYLYFEGDKLMTIQN